MLHSLKKTFLLTLLLLLCVPCVHAKKKDDTTLPPLKPPAYRLGTTDTLENQYNIVESAVPKVNPMYSLVAKKTDLQYSYADSNLKMLSKEVSNELEMDKDEIFEDISILWAGAVQRSETIKFAIYKLSNPDADKPDNKIVEKIISPLASLTTLAGAASADPIISSGAFLGGSLLDIFSKNEKQLNYKYTRVNDADMIVLVRKIDDLQKAIVNYYCDYIMNRNILQMETKILEKRKLQYEAMQNSSKEELLITDAYYREALDRLSKAQNNFLSSRATLEQLVGNETIKKFEEHYSNKIEE